MTLLLPTKPHTAAILTFPATLEQTTHSNAPIDELTPRCILNRFCQPPPFRVQPLPEHSPTNGTTLLLFRIVLKRIVLLLDSHCKPRIEESVAATDCLLPRSVSCDPEQHPPHF